MGRDRLTNAERKAVAADAKQRSSYLSVSAAREEEKEKQRATKAKWTAVIKAEFNNGLTLNQVYKKHGLLMKAALGHDPLMYIEYLYKNFCKSVSKPDDHEDR